MQFSWHGQLMTLSIWCPSMGLDWAVHKGNQHVSNNLGICQTGGLLPVISSHENCKPRGKNIEGHQRTKPGVDTRHYPVKVLGRGETWQQKCRYQEGHNLEKDAYKAVLYLIPWYWTTTGISEVQVSPWKTSDLHCPCLDSSLTNWLSTFTFSKATLPIRVSRIQVIWTHN